MKPLLSACLGLLLALCLCFHDVSGSQIIGYKLQSNMTGWSFFDYFDFFTDDDPTHGYVNYVDREQARSEGLIRELPNSAIYIGTDLDNIASGRGILCGFNPRSPITVASLSWIFLICPLDVALGLLCTHILPQSTTSNPLAMVLYNPGNCINRWLCGPDWPNYGEIDIIEGINVQMSDYTTLHTNQNCSMSQESASLFTGHWQVDSNGKPATDCWDNGSNQGCSIVGSLGSYGKPFNAQGGGVYALEWTEEFIAAWFFRRGSIPSDITVGMPRPEHWGLPYAYFKLGRDSQCTADHFRENALIINLTFCGDWAGNSFSQDCPWIPDDCVSFVKYHPEQLAEAFWTINYVSVYQR